MSFQFDDNDDSPFEDLAKFIEEFQKKIFESLSEGKIDLDDLNSKQFGFSMHIGPDGKPHIAPLKKSHFQAFKQMMPSNNGFEEPLIDVFLNEEMGQYQIIAEVRGIESKDNVHIDVDDEELILHAEAGPYKYKTSKLLKYPIDISSMRYEVRNGVLEITAEAILS